jgi:hypothetical protein
VSNHSAARQVRLLVQFHSTSVKINGNPYAPRSRGARISDSVAAPVRGDAAAMEVTGGGAGCRAGGAGWWPPSCRTVD